jgi:hypothetical protein
MKRGRRLTVMVGCDDHLETFVEILELPTSTVAGNAIKRIGRWSTADNLVQRQETSLATNQAQPLIAYQIAFYLGYISIAPSPTSLFTGFGLMERMGNGMYLR